MLIEDLRAEMDARGLTQAELARMIGVSEPAVSLWLSGDRKIPDMVTVALRALPPGRKAARSQGRLA